MKVRTTVVNLRTEDYDAYIGRPGKGETGYFGNPAKSGTRGQNIAAFTEYFMRRVSTESDFAQRVLDLRGKRLGCFCAPQACHGDVIAKWVDAAICAGCEEAPAEYAIDDPNQEGMPYPDPITVVLLCRECAK